MLNHICSVGEVEVSLNLGKHVFIAAIAGLVSVAATAPLGAVTLGANLIVNGDFESDSGNVVQPSGWTLTPAASDPRAAAVAGIGRDQSRGYFFGSRDFNDQLSQVVQTVNGHEYQIDMWIQADNFLDIANPDNSFFSQFFPYSFNLIQDVADSDFFLLSVTRVAFSSATTFNLFGNSRSGNIYVDDISIREVLSETALPEPATWAMMIGGFSLAGASMRRRKAKLVFS